MSRRRRDACVVQREAQPHPKHVMHPAEPVRFRRGRRWYLVVEVLAYWIEAIPWWQRGNASAREQSRSLGRGSWPSIRCGE